LRVKKTYLSKTLTEEEAKMIGGFQTWVKPGHEVFKITSETILMGYSLKNIFVKVCDETFQG
jgi:hypothetical protein